MKYIDVSEKPASFIRIYVYIYIYIYTGQVLQNTRTIQQAVWHDIPHWTESSSQPRKFQIANLTKLPNFLLIIKFNQYKRKDLATHIVFYYLPPERCIAIRAVNAK